MPLWPTLAMHRASPLASGRAGRMSRSGVRRPALSRLTMQEKELRARPGANPASPLIRPLWRRLSTIGGTDEQISCVSASHAARPPRRSGSQNAERFSRAAPPKNIGSRASSFRLGSSASGFPPPGSSRGCATSHRRSEQAGLSDAKIASFFSPLRSPRLAPGLEFWLVTDSSNRGQGSAIELQKRDSRGGNERSLWLRLVEFHNAEQSIPAIKFS